VGCPKHPSDPTIHNNGGFAFCARCEKIVYESDFPIWREAMRKDKERRERKKDKRGCLGWLRRKGK
jgi:hypothetical protein